MARRSPEPAPLPLMALLLAFVSLGSASQSSTTLTTAPIYLPYYDNKSWSIVQGSIISTNSSADETTFTIFCPEQKTPSCDLSMNFPFIIVEGPKILRFQGTYTSTYTADLGCKLNGTTAATCSGYSSYKSGFTLGSNTGPTEVSWTSTYTGSEVVWGTLTLAEVPTNTGDLGITATAMPTPSTAQTSSVSLPTTTAARSTSDGLTCTPHKLWSLLRLATTLVTAALVL